MKHKGKLIVVVPKDRKDCFTRAMLPHQGHRCAEVDRMEEGDNVLVKVSGQPPLFPIVPETWEIPRMPLDLFIARLRLIK